jgi:hypothetical protein
VHAHGSIVRERRRVLFEQLLRRVLRGSGALMPRRGIKSAIVLSGLLTALLVPALCSLRGAETGSRAAQPNSGPALASGSSLACYSDGVACVHSLDCCSSGCINGQCGMRNKLKRRLAQR